MRHFFLVFLILTLFLGCKKTETNIEIEKEPITVSNTFLERVEPPNWWTGFKDTSLQLLVKEEGIGGFSAEINYPGVTLEKVNKADSPNYLFLDLNISESTKPGKFDIVFKDENGVEKIHTYELKSREKSAEDYKGFDSSDAIYLITPDRFANANPNNDIDQNLLEKVVDRTNDYARHGGDIQGITDHIDYIHDMGFTAVWPCPMLINDMPGASYHGYAITDFYKVDPRFGTLEEYKQLSSELKKRGMKLIMDQVENHCGVEHWWMKDLPFQDWVNQQDAFEKGQPLENSNHMRTVNQDAYASQKDRDAMSQGWFVSSMPDMNQRNSFLAKYLIQNSIWWVETLQLGGIRQDTYPYPDKEFMGHWAGAIMKEYPNLNIVGEEWSTNPLLVAYWQDGHQNKDGYKSNLKSTMDFPMQTLIVQALNEEETWDTGLIKIYTGLANDFAYTSPEDIMIFPDNHDMSRIFTQLNGDIPNTKMALTLVSVLPRIPQIYYGTEILMNDFEKPGDHGLLRGDFPGGWENDEVNAFTGEGLTADQKDMQDFLKKLLNFRKSSEAIHKGRTVHFAPKDGVYVLFRITEGETVAVILNKNNQPVNLDLGRFNEVGLNGKALKNIITQEEIAWNQELALEERDVLILTTKFE